MLRRRAALIYPLLTWRDTLALPNRALVFPRDHGSHPEFRTEWWYLTGYVDAGTASRSHLLGFQITFFRSRIDSAQALQSRFAGKQLLFAHAALTDISTQKHWHDQRIARAGFGIALANEPSTDVKLRDWMLKRNTDGSYKTSIAAQGFSFDLQFTPQQPVLLQGHLGLSRKGPEEKQASYYYSQPQLRTVGNITHAGQKTSLRQGIAWLDHEWSEEILHPQAVGWDWLGMNLFDGSSLTAFQLRRADGTSLWTGGSFRDTVSSTIFKPSDLYFKAGKIWDSPSSGGRYPVQWQVITPHATYSVRALMNAQELDSRNSTGTVYWEGLADLLNTQGTVIGRGYLEMTGYAGRLQI
jgi:predicted secreted hydrolase